MTEAEAKTKWCPMKKFEHFKSETYIGTSAECDMHWAALKAAQDKRAQDMNCIGSACMMWRKDSIPNPDYRPHQLISQWPIVPSYLPSDTDGHCGLSGQP